MKKILLLAILLSVSLLSGCMEASPGYMKIVDDDGTVVVVDKSTNSIITMNVEHYQVHQGTHYYISDFDTVNDGDNVTFATSSYGVDAHMHFDIEGTSQTELYVYENSVVSLGINSTPINNNRNYADDSNMAVSKNPNITSYGTLIYSQTSGLAATNPSKGLVTGLHESNREIVLKRSVVYTWVIVSRQDNNVVSYVGEWYEVE